MTMAPRNTEQQNEISLAIGVLTWFWNNAIIRRYLIASDLSHERMRTIDWFVGEGEDNLPNPLDTESVLKLARSCTGLATCAQREVKPMLEIERRRAGPDMDSGRRAQLDLVLTNLEPNVNALLGTARTLRAAVSGSNSG